MNDRITLKDIANKLGVSIGTVDRALHDRRDVNPETRKRVLELTEKYNYKTNKVARSLSLKSKKTKIGVICPNEAKFFWDQVKNGIKAAEADLSDFGLEIILREIGPERSLDTILQAMDELIDMKADAIALVPVNDPALKEKIDFTSLKGIPVATFNDDIDSSKRIFYVGPQIRQTGRVAGELMGNFLHNSGKVFTISVELESLEYSERLEGFTELIRDQFGGIELIGGITLHYKGVGDGANNLLSNILSGLKDVDGIYDVTGALFYDVADTIKEMRNLRGAVLIGHEIWSGVKDFVMDGTIKACISQDPYSQGFYIVKLLYNYLTEQRLPAFERMYTRLDIIMRENIANQGYVINPYYV